jgi:hypothetical protein
MMTRRSPAEVMGDPDYRYRVRDLAQRIVNLVMSDVHPDDYLVSLNALSLASAMLLNIANADPGLREIFHEGIDRIKAQTEH